MSGKKGSSLCRLTQLAFCPVRHKRKGGGILFSRRPNPKHPKIGVIERRIINIISRPIYEKDLPNDLKYCSRLNERKNNPVTDEVNEYEEFLVRRCKEVFERYKMIIFCQPYSLKMREMNVIWNSLKEKGFDLTFAYHLPVLRRTVEDTKYRNLLPLFNFNVRMVLAEEANVKGVMAVLKKTPQLLVLGGLVDDVLYSKAGLLEVASYPDLQTVQGQTSSLLNMMASKTHSLLQQNQRNLVTNLDQYSLDLQKNESPPAVE